MDLLIVLVLLGVITYLSWRVSYLRRQVDYLTTLLEDGETIRKVTVSRPIDAPVTMRLHLKQDR